MPTSKIVLLNMEYILFLIQLNLQWLSLDCHQSTGQILYKL